MFLSCGTYNMLTGKKASSRVIHSVLQTAVALPFQPPYLDSANSQLAYMMSSLYQASVCDQGFAH